MKINTQEVLVCIVAFFALFGALAVQAENESASHSNGYGPFTASIALGNFDIDTEDSGAPHLNEITYNLMLGYNVSKYFALEAEYFHVESALQSDIFNQASAFGGDAVGLSARIQLPLAEDFRAYLRLGSAAFELKDAIWADLPIETSLTQPMTGSGIQGNYWFVEYVNYGKRDDLYLEQLRGGLILRF